ncbi:hypothetical protein GM3709_3923 (plasmid) [Geminocystis sp. NIES-3709]|nr:hypothetical protein GM3709_3923 [Geminocystis sp. NIES-3709]
MTELFAILETGENLTKTCYQVLFYCIKILDYENRVVLNKSKCAKEIKVSPRLVYESVSTLIKQGFLIPSKEKIGNIQVYHFNPTMIYVGEGKKQSEITSNILMGEF